MDTFLTGIMLFLMLLASFNLFVGVSNDAVNFLSSALGSRAASFNRVMFVAAAGVLLGCTFSSGMMEIARSGIFNPTMFTLLGGSVITASYKLWITTGSLGGLGAYINNEKALSIIIGILSSVIIAFTCGVIIQWIVRMVFSFKFQKVYRYIGGIYSGFCLTAIFYFLVVKGAKGASFMTPELLTWINANTFDILLYTFLGTTVVIQCLIWFFNYNALRLVILAGTFSLAFAFAGNDLVNFVGVPLETFYMGGLKESVQTPTIYLVISGLIMVGTLWFSPKARRVVQTAINLSASDRNEKEQFGATVTGRVIVRSALSVNKIVNQILPRSVLTAIDNRLEKPRLQKGEIPLPFDQVRASVNLVLASILIATATSLKLPLSTTYVTFMVAMGSSLADGAWDRETAVYRISGVLAVISGWFLTAFTAFISCGIAALLCLWLGAWFMIPAGLVVVTLLIRSNFLAGSKKEQQAEEFLDENMTREEIRNRLNNAIGKNLEQTINIFSDAVKALLSEDLSELGQCKSRSQALLDHIVRMRSQYYLMIIHGKDGDYDARNYYYRTFSNMKDVAQLLTKVVSQMDDHIANSHSVFKGVLRNNLLKSISDLKSLQKTLDNFILSGSTSDEVLLRLSNTNLEEVNLYQLELMKQIDINQMPLHRSELYLALLQFYREVVNRYTVIVLLQRELNHMLQDEGKGNISSLTNPETT